MRQSELIKELVFDEQLLFTIMNQLFDVVFLMKVEEGPRFRYVRVSSDALHLASLVEEDMGKCIEEIYPREIAAHLNRQYRKAVETKAIVTYRDQMNVKDSLRIAESTIVPIVKEDGTIPYLICFTRDITEKIEQEEQLEEIHQLFHSFLAHSHDALIVFDLAGRILLVNREVERLLGWHEEEMLSKDILAFLPEYRTRLQRSLMKLGRGESLTSIRLSLMRKDGTRAYVSANITPVFNKDGKIVAGLSMLRDLTDLIQVQEQLRHSEELYRKVIEFLPDPVIIQIDGAIRYMNPSGLEMMKAACLHHVQGRKLSDFLEKGDKESEEWILTSLNGEKKEVQVKETSIHYYGQNAQFLIMRDLSEQKNKEKEIEFMAQYDSLTGLANRNYLKEKLNEFMLHHTGVAVLLIDINRFKFINDFLGHSNGDELLKEVAQRLKKMESQHVFLARIGDDEFAVVSVYEQQKEVDTLLRELDRLLHEPYFIAGEKLNITVNIGVSHACDANLSVETLLSNADKAVYYAKMNGVSHVVEYQSKLHDIFAKKIRLENDLQVALENHEFSLYYQPKVNIRLGTVNVEALIRWKHPQLGMISPAEFIPIAEETNVIDKIGTWVLQQACHDLRGLQKMGFTSLKMAVNLSARQFMDEHLETMVSDIFAEANVSPSSFVFEITETTVMKEPYEVIRILQKLKQKGITIAIDDFGVSYSSLNYLNRFPIDAVKIDRSFIRDLDENHKGAEIVEAIISLAHRLNLEVTAEGVETEEQVRFLLEKGCDEMQGYYFSQPVPLEQLPSVLNDLQSLIAKWK
ncbi:EAL domain-containing protein [Thermaerobacillus caldiproteolyticus]|uniref:EAL domain-containing protein n=1 Tax=Thermaerobacillus caldiproteolyticus TaxID=247480 RepID=UPI00188C1C75|nr:EAL domain-containing protein [Anoxybacillus caldiproteolyticus]QPA31846.1 EAL domain-containing protein [Anoxybacillus caldiproteolyticus]